MSNLDFMGRIAEGKIQEAMEEGKFDNLPGKGKPIVFDDDPLTPPHLRLANRILKNANVLPEWMQIFRDIEADRKQLDDLKRQFLRENRKWGERLAAASQIPGAARQYAAWHAKSRSAYLKALKSVNSSILKFTLVAPSTAQPIRSYKVDAEMAAFDADVPSHLDHAVSTEIDEQSESALRAAARTKYRAAKAEGNPGSD